MGSRDHGMVEFGVQIPMAPFDSLRSLMEGQSNLIKPFRIDDPAKFKLKDFDPADTGEIKSKLTAAKLLQKQVAKISELQEKLYSQDRWPLLLILQGMHASGKESLVKHVMSGV